MAALSLTTRLVVILDQLIACEDEIISRVDKELIIDNTRKNYLEIKNLRILMKYINHVNDSNITLKGCLLNCKIIILNKDTESSEVVDESEEDIRIKELKARRDYLTLRRETREYNRMVFGTESSPNEAIKESFANEFKSLNTQLSVIINMIVAIFVTFGICYFIATKYYTKTSQHLMVGLVGAVLIMFVEMVLYIFRATRVEQYAENTVSNSISGISAVPIRASFITATSSNKESLSIKKNK